MKKFLMIGMMMVLIAPSTALAGKKKNTSSGYPSESIHLNYGATEYTYTSQKSNTQQNSSPKQKSNIGGNINRGGARH